MDATRIYRMNNIHGNAYYIKREDTLPYSFGGNKVRKAMLFFEDLKQNGSNCVVTYGASGSNHCRIVANMAAAMGIPCYIISPNEANRPTTNSRMVYILGANVIQCPVSEVSGTIQKTLDELTAKKYRPYFIQGGGHGNIGTQAYVNVYQEILDYERSEGIYFDYVIHASGTGTTQAGLVCGKIMSQDDRHIIGISIARKNPHGRQVVTDSVNDYLKSKNIENVNSSDITFIDDYIVEGYGTYNDEILRIIQEILITEGIPLDTTYTGKAFWGMRKYIENNGITGKNILFIHTGGTTLFFNDLEALSRMKE